MKKITKKYHVGCSTDDNYVHHASVMICSLLDNNKAEDIVVHVLYDGLSEGNMSFLRSLTERYGSEIVYHKVDVARLDGVRFRTVRPLSMAAYFRLLLSTIITDADRILYLDVDTAVLGDISPLFRLDMKNYALAAVKDAVPCFDDHRMSISLPYDKDYFCSAVMMINLEYWREHGSEARLLEFAKMERTVFCHDQDALNHVFRDEWYQLPPKWNRFNMNYIPSSGFRDYKDRYEYYHAPVIIHFSDYNPFAGYYLVKFASVYRHYLDLSGYRATDCRKQPFLKRFGPIWSYLFRSTLKALRLYDAYLYYRLDLRKKTGRA